MCALLSLLLLLLPSCVSVLVQTIGLRRHFDAAWLVHAGHAVAMLR